MKVNGAKRKTDDANWLCTLGRNKCKYLFSNNFDSYCVMMPHPRLTTYNQQANYGEHLHKQAQALRKNPFSLPMCIPSNYPDVNPAVSPSRYGANPKIRYRPQKGPSSLLSFHPCGPPFLPSTQTTIQIDSREAGRLLCPLAPFRTQRPPHQ